MGKLNTEQEPVLALGGITLASITVLAVAFIGVGRAFNLWDISAEQESEIVKFLAAMWAVGVPLAIAIRSKVYSPNTVENIKDVLVKADPNTPNTDAEIAALTK